MLILLNLAATPTSVLVRKLKMRPSLQELIASKVIKRDIIQKLAKGEKFG